jgi:hypothetical protein
MPRACLRLSLVTLDARTRVAVRCSAMQAPSEWTEAARIAHHMQSCRTQPRETHLSHATSSHATPSHATSPHATQSHATSSHATPAHATSSHARHASSREPASHEQALLPRHEARRSEEGSDSIHPASRVCHWRPVPHTHARRARRGRILSTPRAASATGSRSLIRTQEERGGVGFYPPREPRLPLAAGPSYARKKSEEGSDSIHPASRVCHWRPVPHTHARRARRGRILSTPRAASATGGRSLTSTQEERREPRCRHALLLWREQQ